MRFGSTAKVLARCMLKYYRISECCTLDWPRVTASTMAASRHSTVRKLYRVAPVSCLLDTVREFAITKVAPAGSTTSVARTCVVVTRMYLFRLICSMEPTACDWASTKYQQWTTIPTNTS